MFERRKVRYGSNVLFALILAVSLFIAGGLGAIYAGFFGNGQLKLAMEESGYYDTVFQAMRQETELAVTMAGAPSSVVDALTYEDVRIALLRQAEGTESGGAGDSAKWLSGKVEAAFHSYLEGEEISLTAQAEDGLTRLTSYLEANYEQDLTIPGREKWLADRADFMRLMNWLLPLTLCLAVGCCVVLVLIQHYMHRGLRWAARGILLACAALALCSFLTGRGAEAVQLSAMWQNYVLRGMGTGWYTAGIGLVLALCFEIASRGWKG